MNFGWCETCATRVGSKKFRELVIGNYCLDCVKRFKIKPLPNPGLNNDGTSNKSTTKRKSRYKPVLEPKKRGRKPKEKQPKPKSQLFITQREDELTLLTAFQLVHPHFFTDSWCDRMGLFLGWSKNEVKVVAKRLRRWGHQAPPYNTDKLIMLEVDKLQSCYFTAYDVKVSTLCPEYIRIRLHALAKQGMVQQLPPKPGFRTPTVYCKVVTE